MGLLDGKVALVTGAKQGIGRGIALCLAEAGADVVVNDIAPETDMQEVIGKINQIGRRGIAWKADVSNRDEVEALVEGATKRFGSLDIAVANAGMSVRKPFTDFEWTDVERVLATCQFGVFHTCQFAARKMVAQGRGGKIVLIASVHAQFPFARSAPYNMAKAAITHLGLTMANELAPHRINVNVIHPGWIDTPGERTHATEAEIQKGAEKIPWRRLGTPSDIGKAVTFLASDDADYITGACLRVDGGFALGLKLA
ncbi:MAG TPA: glucose 1-dehydrogenase [Terriglobia bacterium]|nr:glucose 1-dehydrogenase [Terriglobia bacterium]